MPAPGSGSIGQSGTEGGGHACNEWLSSRPLDPDSDAHVDDWGGTPRQLAALASGQRAMLLSYYSGAIDGGLPPVEWLENHTDDSGMHLPFPSIIDVDASVEIVPDLASAQEVSWTGGSHCTTSLEFAATVSVRSEDRVFDEVFPGTLRSAGPNNLSASAVFPAQALHGSYDTRWYPAPDSYIFFSERYYIQGTDPYVQLSIATTQQPDAGEPLSSVKIADFMWK